LTRAHQLNDSPVLGGANGRPRAARGLYSTGARSRLALLVRLLGENPFILAMLVTPVPVSDWATHMYLWAIAILAWAVLTTFGGPLRILGPGFHYMKASVFPSAYALAVTVNVQEGDVSLPRVALLVSLLASLAALAYFYRVMSRRETEHTAQTPPDLARAADFLSQLEGRNVVVLPSMYADFIAFNANKSVVWGGHSGDLRKFEEFFPVIRRPLEYFFEKYQVEYVVLDLAYASPRQLRIEDRVDRLAAFGAIGVYGVRAAPSPAEVPTRASAIGSTR